MLRQFTLHLWSQLKVKVKLFYDLFSVIGEGIEKIKSNLSVEIRW